MMSMRRFFRAQRDEDYSQIQYLTAKCTRLAHDKAVLEREFLVSRERERRLRNDLDATTSRLVHQEQVIMELRTKQEQLSCRSHQQQDMVSLLQQRIVLLVEESSRDAEMLQEVSDELLCLQSSEVKLERLVEELHAEAQHRAVVAESLQVELHAEAQRRAEQAESLQAELHRRTEEVEQLQEVNRALTEELSHLSRAHHREVRALQQENEGSLRKLQETAEQFEWLCQQQRYWMCCVKRFKDCLLEEREALLQQVNMLEKNAEKLKTPSHRGSPTPSQRCPLQDTEHHDSITLWASEQVDELESRGQRSNVSYEELFHQAGSLVGGHQKPP